MFRTRTTDSVLVDQIAVWGSGEDGTKQGEVVQLNGRITALKFAPELCGLEQVIVGTADGEMAYVSNEGKIAGGKKSVVKFGGRIDSVHPSSDGVRAIWVLDF